MKLSSFVSGNEKILYSGKPDKAVTILEGIFNPMLPFALLWGAFDFGIIGVIFHQDTEGLGGFQSFLLLFFLIHLMPVWIYLGGVITAGLKYKNTEYVITTKGLYVATGIITFNYEMKPFADLAHITIHQGFIDRILGTGDVISSCGHSSTTAMSYSNTSGHGHHSHGMNICNIRDYEKVFKLLQKLQEDIYADTMFPNQYRPGINPGYQTSYGNNDFLVNLDMDIDPLQAPVQENRYGNNMNPYGNNNNPYANNPNPFANRNPDFGNNRNPYGSNGNPYGNNGNPYGNNGNPYGNNGNPYGNNGNPYASQPMNNSRPTYPYTGGNHSSVEIDTFTS